MARRWCFSGSLPWPGASSSPRLAGMRLLAARAAPAACPRLDEAADYEGRAGRQSRAPTHAAPRRGRRL